MPRADTEYAVGRLAKSDDDVFHEDIVIYKPISISVCGANDGRVQPVGTFSKSVTCVTRTTTTDTRT